MNSTQGLIRRSVYLSAWFFCVSAFGQAQTAQPPAARPGAVEVEASRVYTFVKGAGIGHSHGMEARLASGHLVVGASSQAGQLVIDLASFDADTPAARAAVGLKGTTANWMRGQVRKEMLGSKILDAANYPTATLDIRSCLPNGGANASGAPSFELAGSLTLHGVSQPVAFPVAVEQTDGWLRLTGSYSFKQSDFGIKPYSKGFGAIGVADEVVVYGDIWVAPTQASMASLPSVQRR